MIDVFYGEFGFVSTALNVGLNTCCHNCIYCFANGKKAGRRSALSRIKRLVDADGETGNALGALYRAGYPVSMCNETDILSPNNVREAFAVLSLFSRRNTPVLALTKGGARTDEDELISRLAEKGNSILYVSVTCGDDDTCRRIEPGAFPTSARLDLLRRASRAGVPCICALNPLFKPWMPEDRAVDIMRQCQDAGINMFLIHALRLSAQQRKCGAFDADTLGILKRREQYDYANQVMCTGYIDLKADVYAPGCPFPSTDYFTTQERVFGKRWPVLHDFIKWSAEKQYSAKKRMIFTAKDFESALMAGREELYGMGLDMCHTVLAQSMATFRDNPLMQRKVSISRFLKCLWNDHRFRFFSPRLNLTFQTAINGDGKPWRDMDGNILLVRDGCPHFDGDREVVLDEEEVRDYVRQ